MLNFHPLTGRQNPNLVERQSFSGFLLLEKEVPNFDISDFGLEVESQIDILARENPNLNETARLLKTKIQMLS